MKSRVEQHPAFVRLLLSVNKIQAIVLLKNLNRLQIQVISEIIQNVLVSNIKLSSYYKCLLSKKKTFYINLASKLNYNRKIHLVRNNPELVFVLLRAVKKDVIEVLNGSQEDDIVD